MKLLCLSHIVSQITPSYGDRDRVIIRDNSSIKKGETANSSCWIFSNNHIGTHIDVPYHSCNHGKKIYDLPVKDFFFNKIDLVDIPCTKSRLIRPKDFSDLTKLIEKDIELLLIRTGYEKYRQEDKYWNDNPGFALGLATYFRQNYPLLRCVGFDFISLTSWRFRPVGRESHREFLCPEAAGMPILIIEDMALSEVREQIERVIVAPMLVEDGNGGPVTVFAEING